MFSLDWADKKPAKTDTFADSLHACRESEKMANRTPTWRTRGEWARDMANGADRSPGVANPNGSSHHGSQSHLPGTSLLRAPRGQRCGRRSVPAPIA